MKYKKSYFSKVYKQNVNNWYLDIDFYLEVCGLIVFLELFEQELILLKLYRVNKFRKHALFSLLESSTDL